MGGVYGKNADTVDGRTGGVAEKMAAAQHESMAEIIRQAVDFFAKAKRGRGRRAASETGNGGRRSLQIRCYYSGNLTCQFYAA